MNYIMLLISFFKSIFVSKAPTVSKSVLPLRLNIQYFADGEDDGGDDGDEEDKDNSEDDKDKDKDTSFTSEQQKKIDALIAKTIAKERANRDKDIEAAKTEAEKLAKMNADQKAEYESKKREDEIAKRESDITRRELRASALETLAEKGLPKQLAEILVFTDAESTNTSLDAVEKAFREAVETGVNERLKGTPPGGGGGKGSSTTSVGANFAKTLNEKSKPVSTTLWD